VHEHVLLVALEPETEALQLPRGIGVRGADGGRVIDRETLFLDVRDPDDHGR